jgi:MscS family membrane protein
MNVFQNEVVVATEQQVALPAWLETYDSWDVPLSMEAIGIIILSFILAMLVDRILFVFLRAVAKRTSGSFDDQLLLLLRRPVIKSVVLAGLAFATWRLGVDFSSGAVTFRALITIGVVIWVLFAFRFSKLFLLSASEATERFSIVEGRTYPLFDNLAKLVIFGVGTYSILSIWKIDITGWAASAGIIGIAVGFASKDTLSNLFAGVFIIADAPYKVGDFIVLESGERGQVINIGLRSTRILTRDDIEITVPNAVMGNARITNETSGPSPKHRIRVRIGVAYGSDIDIVREILIKAAADEPGICDDPEPRVRFRSFGDSGLNFELMGWIPEPVLRGRILDGLNTRVYKSFNANGIEIPYPKQDLYLKEMPR